MTAGITLPPEIVAEALRLRAEGLTVSQVGDVMGRSKNSISGILSRHGGIITRKPETGAAIAAAKAIRRSKGGGGRRGGPVADDDPEQVERARALWNRGQSLRAIGLAMNVGKDVVERWRKRYRWATRAPMAAPQRVASPTRDEAMHHAVRPLALAPTPREPPEERRCQFPIGTPRAAGFRFCGNRVTRAAGSYCDECRRIAYHRVAA